VASSTGKGGMRGLVQRREGSIGCARGAAPTAWGGAQSLDRAYGQGAVSGDDGRDEARRPRWRGD
jgi:hypothetical protein